MPENVFDKSEDLGSKCQSYTTVDNATADSWIKLFKDTEEKLIHCPSDTEILSLCGESLSGSISQIQQVKL